MMFKRINAHALVSVVGTVIGFHTAGAQATDLPPVENVMPPREVIVVDTPASSQDGRLSIGIGVTTFGITPELMFRLSDNVYVRTNVGYFTTSRSQSLSGIDYDIDAKLASVGLLADYQLGDSGFFITGGVRYHASKIDVNAKYAASETIEIGGERYTISGNSGLTGSIEPKNKFAPYVGAVYRWGLTDSFSIDFELGAMYMGKLEAEVKRVGTTFTDDTGQLLDTDRLAAEVDAEIAAEVKSLNDELSKYVWYPGLGITASYRF